MIQIRHRGAIPRTLIAEGNVETGNLIRGHGAGQWEFDFNRDIYACEEVKDRLVDVHHGKCGYCEAYIRHVTPGDVEHFRPKKGFNSRRGQRLTRPGYFWLAYDWDNILLACEICNRKHKRNLFPLFDEQGRALPAVRDVSLERPVLLNPNIEDPEHVIEFNDEFVRPVGGNNRGQRIIKILGLDREELDKIRKVHLDLILSLIRIVVIQPPHVDREECLDLLRTYASAESQFSSCTRSYLRKHGLEGLIT